MPFTIESSDWMFNFLYEHYLFTHNREKMHEIRAAYIDYTLSMFDYIEHVTDKLLHRSIPHIFLCHDNPLNAHALPLVVKELKARRYTFISLDEALNDPAYQQKVHYKGKLGFTWIYRWMEDAEKRRVWMKNEPSMDTVYKEYEKIKEANK